MKWLTEKDARQGIIMGWVGLAVSSLLLAGLFALYLTDHIPGYILPLVNLVSGEQENLAVALYWTAGIGMFSTMGLLGSLGALACGYTLRWLHRRGTLHLAP